MSQPTSSTDQSVRTARNLSAFTADKLTGMMEMIRSLADRGIVKVLVLRPSRAPQLAEIDGLTVSVDPLGNDFLVVAATDHRLFTEHVFTSPDAVYTLGPNLVFIHSTSSEGETVDLVVYLADPADV